MYIIVCLIIFVNCVNILGAFEKLQKATVSFVMSVRASVHMEQLDSHWTDFVETL